LGKDFTFYEIHKKDELFSFLDTKIKNNDVDPEKKWITTWNDYPWRIKYFFRWFHSYKLVKERAEEPSNTSNHAISIYAIHFEESWLQGKIIIITLCFIASLLVILHIFLSDQISILPNSFAQLADTGGEQDKVVILNFDDGRKSQFTHAKPILDKYGFKATFYVVCNYLDNKKGYMNWKEVKILQKEGHDIESHSMNHAHLEKLSEKGAFFEIAQSKKCLEDHGINATSFAYPFNEGASDKKVINIVAKYYDLARTASGPITFLRCDGWKEQHSNQDDCRPYSKKGDLTYANRYTIQGWGHDLSRLENSYDNPALFDRFIEVVNSQSEYNKNGIIKAIPIIIYHRAGDSGVADYNTDLDLFEKEMKYLHDEHFTVLTMADLAYNKKSNYLYIKEFTTPKITTVKAIQNATTKATEPTMVKAIQNATAKATEPTMVKAIQNATALDVLTNLPKNNTSIVLKQPSNVALHDNATSIEMANRLIDAASFASQNAHATSIEMANRLIDAASFASQNAHATLTNLPKNNTSIVLKQPSNVALHDNATSIEMANRLIDAASKASLNTMGVEDFDFGEGHYTDKTRGGDR
jgi:peptidoglycan/xylan/chitin deacetylase (PgdA/CDA1 family)